MRRSPFRNCTFMSAVGTKFYSLNSIRRQDGWAGKCTTLADIKRVTQSWWWLCWTRGQNALHSEHCWQEEGGVILWERGQSSARWMAQGRAQHWVAAPPNWEEATAVRQAGLRFVLQQRWREQLAPPKFSLHLLLTKNAPEDLEGITPQPRKTIWPNLLQSNCWPPNWKVLSSSTCANTPRAWAPTHTSTQTGQGEMVVHLSLVSLRLLASTDLENRGKDGTRSFHAFCRE